MCTSQAGLNVHYVEQHILEAIIYVHIVNLSIRVSIRTQGNSNHYQQLQMIHQLTDFGYIIIISIVIIELC